MTIHECIKKKHGWVSEVGELKRFQTVDICFINAEGKEDETEFDICGAGTNVGMTELEELYKNFCHEIAIKTNTVIGVYIVAAADTKKELEGEG